MKNFNSLNQFTSLKENDLNMIYGGRGFWRGVRKAAYHVYDAINSYGNGILNNL